MSAPALTVRLVGRAVVAYLLLCIGGGLLSVITVPVARSLAGDERIDLVPGVDNQRVVDDRLWVGGQPAPADYHRFAELGVRTVVDLRTGASDDPSVDDPSLLDDLGIAYERIPVADGHAPSLAQVRRFHRIVTGSPGVVYLHCGGGVGRTVAMEAGYTALEGREPDLAALLSVGPVTLAQAWFGASAGADGPEPVGSAVRRASELLDAPRRAVSRIRSAL